jgi:hypothetical protein
VAARLIERLAAVIPAPRSNQILYAGVLAANATWRREVVPKAPAPKPDQATASRGVLKPGHGHPCPAPDRRAPCFFTTQRGDLLWRVFGIADLHARGANSA